MVSPMEPHVQDWMLRLEQSLLGIGREFGPATAAVREESAALGAQLERIESKLDEVLARLDRIQAR